MGTIDLKESKEVIRKVNDYFIQELGALAESDGNKANISLLKKLDKDNKTSFEIYATSYGIALKIPTTISTRTVDYPEFKGVPCNYINDAAFQLVNNWGKIKAMVQESKDRLTKEYNDVISKMPDFDPNE